MTLQAHLCLRGSAYRPRTPLTETDSMAGVRGLELANVIFRKPLIMLGKIPFGSANIGTRDPSAADLQQRSSK
jgi:hypothetical protein